MIEKDSMGTDSEFQLSYSVAKAFQPTNAGRTRAAGLATSLESLEANAAVGCAALEPIKALCEHMRKLPDTFAPL